MEILVFFLGMLSVTSWVVCSTAALLNTKDDVEPFSISTLYNPLNLLFRKDAFTPKGRRYRLAAYSSVAVFVSAVLWMYLLQA